MYDYFVAAMKCLNCGTMSAADSSTNMQTHLRDDASGIELGLGFHFEPLEVRGQDIMASSYISTGRVSVDGRSRLLEMWRCPACGTATCARVRITGTVLTEIDSVLRGRARLHTA